MTAIIIPFPAPKADEDESATFEQQFCRHTWGTDTPPERLAGAERMRARFIEMGVIPPDTLH